MQLILECCCGLDVHKSMVMACIAYGPLDKPPKFEIRKFSTLTHVTDLHRFLLKQHLAHIDFLAEQMKKLEPYETAMNSKISNQLLASKVSLQRPLSRKSV